MTRKIYLDAAIFVLFILVMSFHFLPRILHEILGVAMAVVVFVHLVLNRHWIFSLVRANRTSRKNFLILINFLLLVSFLVTLVTGLFISNYVFIDFVSWEFRRNVTIHLLHHSASYLVMILIGVHLGLHWQEIWGRVIHCFGLRKNALSYKICCRLVVSVLICVGIYGSFLNRVGDRILMKHIFATAATELHFIVFSFLLVSNMALYAILSFKFSERMDFLKSMQKNCVLEKNCF